MKSGSIQPPSGHFQDSDNRGSRDGEIMHSEEAEMVGPFSRPQGGSDDPPLDIPLEKVKNNQREATRMALSSSFGTLSHDPFVVSNQVQGFFQSAALSRIDGIASGLIPPSTVVARDTVTNRGDFVRSRRGSAPSDSFV